MPEQGAMGSRSALAGVLVAAMIKGQDKVEEAFDQEVAEGLGAEGGKRNAER